MVGAYLNTLPGRLYYWRERNYEVDFVYEFGKQLHAIEVKYGKNRSTKGLEKFLEKFPHATTHIITPDNFDSLKNL
jgi:predicted AAA+ superfamily ATPase